MIKTTLKCNKIGPLDDLNSSENSSSLKFGVFANNGSGKTFISRMFRLAENPQSLSADTGGNIPTDYLIRFKNNNASFTFKVSKESTDIEDLEIELKKGIVSTVPNPYYLYHVFNQDYVDENIKNQGYVKDGSDVSLQTYILGKANIDLSDDKKALANLGNQIKETQSKIENCIANNLKEISQIPNIRRLSEYHNINIDMVIQANGNIDCETKTIKEYLSDYDKIKSVPENIQYVSEVQEISDNHQTNLSQLLSDLSQEYSLSSFADSFKQEVKSKEDFLRIGVNNYTADKDKKYCPFCKQELQQPALKLIDEYVAYFKDREALTIQKFRNEVKSIDEEKNSLRDLKNKSIIQSNVFNDYKTKYFVSQADVSLVDLDLSTLMNTLENLRNLVLNKINDISKSIVIDSDTLQNVLQEYEKLNNIIRDNAAKVDKMNNIISNVSQENRNIRRDICLAAFNQVVKDSKADIQNRETLLKTYRDLSSSIEKKERAAKTIKRSAVAKTIKEVLNCFFSGEKYTLDEETFHLQLYNKTLENGEVKHVLSEGEKNIIAFAYYLGDTHLIVSKEEDYKKLFFVIDDPISSMDYNYVYTVSGVIRNIAKILPELGQARYIILTHNNDFMRIIVNNKIVDKTFFLNDGKLKHFSENFTVPYINHLIDIYKIANGYNPCSYTTANSIRHILETLIKFENISLSENSINNYIEANFKDDETAFTLINDLSHGGWRDDQQPIDGKQYERICGEIVELINTKYKGQIEFCKRYCEEETSSRASHL